MRGGHPIHAAGLKAMILAACVHCDHDISYAFPEGATLPAVAVRRCGGCGRANVCRVCVMAPEGWSLAAGLKEYGADPGAVAFIRRRAAELGCDD